MGGIFVCGNIKGNGGEGGGLRVFAYVAIHGNGKFGERGEGGEREREGRGERGREREGEREGGEGRGGYQLSHGCPRKGRGCDKWPGTGGTPHSAAARLTDGGGWRGERVGGKKRKGGKGEERVKEGQRRKGAGQSGGRRRDGTQNYSSVHPLLPLPSTPT